MLLMVNGKSEETAVPLTIQEYLEERGIVPEGVVVEVNGQLPERASWGQWMLAEGDRLEILLFLGGGC